MAKEYERPWTTSLVCTMIADRFGITAPLYQAPLVPILPRPPSPVPRHVGASVAYGVTPGDPLEAGATFRGCMSTSKSLAAKSFETFSATKRTVKPLGKPYGSTDGNPGERPERPRGAPGPPRGPAWPHGPKGVNLQIHDNSVLAPP